MPPRPGKLPVYKAPAASSPLPESLKEYDVPVKDFLADLCKTHNLSGVDLCVYISAQDNDKNENVALILYLTSPNAWTWALPSKIIRPEDPRRHFFRENDGPLLECLGDIVTEQTGLEIASFIKAKPDTEVYTVEEGEEHARDRYITVSFTVTVKIPQRGRDGKGIPKMFHSSYHDDEVQLAWVRKKAILQGHIGRKGMALARNFSVPIPEESSLTLDFTVEDIEQFREML